MRKIQREPLDWDDIDTVFLDMDGTLLDLRFDNHFWLEHMPVRYAEIHGIDERHARQELYRRFDAIRGTLDWYCLDYWSRELGLDLVALKREVADLIVMREHVPEFLQQLAVMGKRRVLLTNAHRGSVALKMEMTELSGHLDRVISAHDLRCAKEEPGFWSHLQAVEAFDPARSLLIDDNLDVLSAAAGFGLGQVLAVRRPDSAQQDKETGEFNAVDDFRWLVPGTAVSRASTS